MSEGPIDEAQEVKSASTEELEEKEKVPKKKKKREQKRTKGKVPARRKKKPVYNVDRHPETGVMQLQELYYLRLIAAEQLVKISERDLQLAKHAAKDFQTSANAQLQVLQSKVKEASDSLGAKRMSYFSVVKEVEESTSLSLKDWTVDDDRILRPIEEDKST